MAAGGVTNQYGSDFFQAAIAYHPAFGMKSTYVGGDYNNGAFGYADFAPGGNPNAAGGRFYVSRVDEARFPSTLITFVSSQGGDVREGSWWSYGAQLPENDSNTQVNRPGYYYVEPPRAHPTINPGDRRVSGAPMKTYLMGSSGGGWTGPSTDNAWRTRGVKPSHWGMISARHFSKSTVAMLDGHIEMLTIEQLRDMRRWANYAKTADWNWPASQPWDR